MQDRPSGYFHRDIDLLTLIFDKLAEIVALPKCFERGFIRGGVVVANEGLEVLSGFGPAVCYKTIRLRSKIPPKTDRTERHLREVVDDAKVSDIVEEEASLLTQEVPVGGSSGATLKVPFLTMVVGEHGVGAVQVSDHDDYSSIRRCQPLRRSLESLRHTPV
jgi:hypothetical protein